MSPDQIHLSALKGEGELKNLELNDQVLTELLELPSWLRLTKATCNRVSVRIQWTKLKSIPIHLSLDEVHVEVETCEDLRQTSAAAGGAKIPSYATGGPYGYGDKVVDGITVTINSVLLTLKSHAFIASFQMSRILVESKSPTWKKADLRMTRVKDTDKGELLIFKELSWQTVRIEAKSTINDDLTPLRLITNQARCRITIKKKIADCSVLGCRLVVILDDLLWVLTDDQLKAALHYADSLSGLLKRATEETQKVKGARKMQSIAEGQNIKKDKGSAKKDKKSSAQQTSGSCVSAKVFSRYDVVETSYHFYSDRIDLHLCDDPGGKGRSCHPRLSDGGAFQVSFSELQVDFYPYHVINVPDDRDSWIRYSSGSVHASWLEQSLALFQSALMEAAMATDAFSSSKVQHTPLSRSNAKQSAPNNGAQITPMEQNRKDNSNGEVRNALLGQFHKLMTTNLIVRLKDFAMWKVSISKGKTAPQEFLSGDRQRYSLPEDMPVMHFEYTQFYYPGDISFPLPPPKLFAYFNPIQLSLDPLTVLWLNAFALNLQRSVKLLSLEHTEPPYLDVKIEAIMFRIALDADEENFQRTKQKDRPKSLHIQASRVLASNYRSLDTGTKADLSKCLDVFHKSSLYTGNGFPNMPSDIPIICDAMVQHVEGEADVAGMLNSTHIANSESGLPRHVKEVSGLKNPTSLWPVMQKKLLWTESRDVWHVSLDPLWADFQGTPATGSRPVPLVDAFPFTMWLYKQPEDIHSLSIASGNKSNIATSNVKSPNLKNKEQVAPQFAKMHLLAQISNLVSLQLNHYQLLFLMRLIESIGEITTFLTQDVSHILGEEDESSMALGLIAPQVDISLVMPSISQSRDNIGGDYDISLASYNDLNSTEGMEGDGMPGNSCSTSIYSMGDLKNRVNNEEQSLASNVTSPPETLTLNSGTTTPTPDGQPECSSLDNLSGLSINNRCDDQHISLPVSPSKPAQSKKVGESIKVPPALPPRGNPSSNIQGQTINSVINDGAPGICSSLPVSSQSFGTPTRHQPTPAIQLSSPTTSRGPTSRPPQVTAKIGSKKTSQSGTNNLTSSLSNMMSQLDSSIRGGSGSSSQQSLLDNDDNASLKVPLF